jgi:hypothetical protein
MNVATLPATTSTSQTFLASLWQAIWAVGKALLCGQLLKGVHVQLVLTHI